MSYRLRQAKARTQIAQESAQRQAHQTGSAADKWWLTPATKPCCCNKCGRMLRPRASDLVEIVYRRQPETILCVPCAQEANIFYRPSLLWEKAAKKARRAA